MLLAQIIKTQRDIFLFMLCSSLQKSSQEVLWAAKAQFITELPFIKFRAEDKRKAKSKGENIDFGK